MNDTGHDASRMVRLIAIVGGLTFAALGLWAFIDPHGFFENIAPWPPFNAHLLRDSGVFQVGLGVAILLVVWRPDKSIVGVLSGASTAAVLHVASHIIDHPHGGQPFIDFPILTGLAIALIAATAISLRRSD